MSAIVNHPHRVTTALTDTRSELSSVTEVPLWTMDAGQLTDALDQLLAVEAQLAELKGRLLGQAKSLDLPGQSGAPNTATWYAARTRTTKLAAYKAARVATGLEAHQLPVRHWPPGPSWSSRPRSSSGHWMTSPPISIATSSTRPRPRSSTSPPICIIRSDGQTEERPTATPS